MAPSRSAAWRPVLPGIGLVLGAGLGLIVSLVVSSAPASLVTGVLVGAGLGLLIGASARGHAGGDVTEPRP